MPTNIHSNDIPQLHVTTYDYHQLSQFILSTNKLNEIQWRNYFSSTSLWSSHHLFRTEGTNETHFLSLMEKHSESHTTFLLQQKVKLRLYSTDGQFSANSCHPCNYAKYMFYGPRGDTNIPAVINCLTM